MKTTKLERRMRTLITQPQRRMSLDKDGAPQTTDFCTEYGRTTHTSLQGIRHQVFGEKATIISFSNDYRFTVTYRII